MIEKAFLKEMIDVYLDAEFENERSENSLKRYRCAINNFLKHIPDGELSKRNMIKFKKHLIEKYKPATVNNYIIIINKFIKYCEMVDAGDDRLRNLKEFQRKKPSDLTISTIKIQEKTSLETVISKEEYQRLLRAAKKNKREDLYYLMRILAETGIRIGELRYFTKDALQSNYITVRNKGKSRDVIVNPALRRDLIKYAEKQGMEDKLFDYSYSKIYSDLHMIAGKARGIDLKKIHPHAFRHLFATRYMEKIGDVTELKDILGHTNLNTTTIYSKSTKEQKKKHLEKLWK